MHLWSLRHQFHQSLQSPEQRPHVTRVSRDSDVWREHLTSTKTKSDWTGAKEKRRAVRFSPQQVSEQAERKRCRRVVVPSGGNINRKSTWQMKWSYHPSSSMGTGSVNEPWMYDMQHHSAEMEVMKITVTEAAAFLICPMLQLFSAWQINSAQCSFCFDCFKMTVNQTQWCTLMIYI